ncbi:class I SAM-dependent methyltransferase [Sphingomonas paeninsulae]|jgi:SAM-dependent methyltransferase|uniref:Class I SAM-dependent methyltransferase n=2 Tax=Sphingomonas paeninsulae TaxID=2319844 RepID=A0A494TQV5_SPHPE|nr:class I SAM-dependent methyltransferase [Sphingomonas paeninsulae]
MAPGYHESRLSHDPRRDVLWQSLWRYYFRKRIAPTDCVLDLGCGYGEFINNVTARRRIGLDVWNGSAAHLDKGVEPIVSSVTALDGVDDGSVDYAFASNLFEHVTQSDFAQVLASLRRKLSPSGTLTILQPNYRYAYREYFDDYTHISVYSHISLADFLRANGYDVIEVRPRFLPLTVKSRLPVWPFLIGLYLALPFKPMGKQMLIRARPQSGSAIHE